MNKRDEFLNDIIIGSVEGGSNYWAQCSHYQYVDDDGTTKFVVGSRTASDRTDTYAVLHDMEQDATAEPLVVDKTTVRKGIEKISAGGVVNWLLTDAIKYADKNNDAGVLDAEGYDVIVQAGLFGEVVYG